LELCQLSFCLLSLRYGTQIRKSIILASNITAPVKSAPIQGHISDRENDCISLVHQERHFI
jgi:hypothetical protein